MVQAGALSPLRSGWRVHAIPNRFCGAPLQSYVGEPHLPFRLDSSLTGCWLWERLSARIRHGTT